VTAPERPRPTGGTTVRGLAVLVAGTLVLGVVLGVVWARLAPGQRFVVLDATSLATLPTESEHVFVDAALFVLLGLVGGLVSAVVAWRWRRARGPVVLLVLTAASVLAAVLAHVVGLLLVPRPDVAGAAPGTVVTSAPELRTWLVVLGQPLGAALGYVVATFTSGDELGPEVPHPAPFGPDGVSSASPASPADPAGPVPPAAR